MHLVRWKPNWWFTSQIVSMWAMAKHVSVYSFLITPIMAPGDHNKRVAIFKPECVKLSKAHATTEASKQSQKGSNQARLTTGIQCTWQKSDDFLLPGFYTKTANLHNSSWCSMVSRVLCFIIDPRQRGHHSWQQVPRMYFMLPLPKGHLSEDSIFCRRVPLLERDACIHKCQ